MKILQHICLLTTSLTAFTLLLCCSDGKQENNLDLSKNQNTKVSNSNTNQFNLAEFERNRELWTSKNIQNYKMIIGASGFLINFPEEVLIEVKNRRANSIKSLSKTGKNHTETYEDYNTIEKIFDFIDKRKGADKLKVVFDENLGHPNQVVYDRSSDMTDDELQIQIKSLEVFN